MPVVGMEGAIPEVGMEDTIPEVGMDRAGDEMTGDRARRSPSMAGVAAAEEANEVAVLEVVLF